MFCLANVGNVETAHQGVNSKHDKHQKKQRSTQSARCPCHEGSHGSNKCNEFARYKESVSRFPCRYLGSKSRRPAVIEVLYLTLFLKHSHILFSSFLG